jgi:mRNA interferase MazF
MTSRSDNQRMRPEVEVRRGGPHPGWPAKLRNLVVILSRDTAIPRLRRALIAPCTTTIRGLASEVLLEPDQDPIPLGSAVNLDSVESVSVGTLTERLGRLGDGRMREICAALAIAVDCSP